MAARSKKLTKPEVQKLIDQLNTRPTITNELLLAFAEKVNGGPFKTPKPTLKFLKEAVLSYFGCKTVPDLKKNKTFSMSMTGETISLKTKADWMKLYRKWIEVHESERAQTGPTCINGIDVLENFRPWHVFGLNSKTAGPEDVKKAFNALAKIHHPDHGGDQRVIERLKKMRDSVLAQMKTTKRES